PHPSPPLTRTFHSRSVAQTSKSAVSQVTKPAGAPVVLTCGRFGNRRYSRFGNLRYACFARLPSSASSASILHKLFGSAAHGEKFDARRVELHPRRARSPKQRLCSGAKQDALPFEQSHGDGDSGGSARAGGPENQRDVTPMIGAGEDF